MQQGPEQGTGSLGTSSELYSLKLLREEQESKGISYMKSIRCWTTGANREYLLKGGVTLPWLWYCDSLPHQTDQQGLETVTGPGLNKQRPATELM